MLEHHCTAGGCLNILQYIARQNSLGDKAISPKAFLIGLESLLLDGRVLSEEVTRILSLYDLEEILSLNDFMYEQNHSAAV